jgi:hypothetical protein
MHDGRKLIPHSFPSSTFVIFGCAKVPYQIFVIAYAVDYIDSDERAAQPDQS